MVVYSLSESIENSGW